jgi:tetraacyldisaccharide 4'-kinase
MILDDGLQHRALRRDVDIVSIFAGSERAVVDFVRGALLPAGFFREKRDKALQRASLIVISHRTVFGGDALPPIDERLKRVIPNSKHLFQMYLRASGVTSLTDNTEILPQRVCAFAAIANPEGFFDSLSHLGFEVAHSFPFRDHHQFIESELRSLFEVHPNLTFICTAKDAVKLSRLPEWLRKRCGVLRVDANVEPYQQFFQQIESLIEGGISRSAA